MPYFATSQEWLHQSSLLLEARPTTTRITTKYHISKPKPRRAKKAPTSSSSPPTTDTAPAAPRGSLTLKTYDPHSGACLKYRTTKAAEVSRLIQSLGRPLAARMAALPLPEAADEVMADAPLAAGTPADEKRAEDVGGPALPEGSTGGGKAPGQAQGQAGGGGGGGKGKKKRGKK
ncbi:signal recognition particle 9 kDa protein-domain-containing protein [Daldinia decipiens]|uniref:signal recognition particle 9 kDa protein-domain-containing protein n=1 Tax=Daldinia decipiens TaxID=326647 RepID=UPI0020C251C1|nr:signal recognition particle 9 kDa protein-domain-containing protein [Daldinia decipiens]KAI1661671.1 signal recognition particle 9 kDa protein-domain-containing protein [Daldinia decipiens]